MYAPACYDLICCNSIYFQYTWEQSGTNQWCQIIRNSIPYLTPHKWIHANPEKSPIHFNRDWLTYIFRWWWHISFPDNLKLYGLVSIDSCTLLTRQSASSPPLIEHNIYTRPWTISGWCSFSLLPKNIRKTARLSDVSRRYWNGKLVWNTLH